MPGLFGPFIGALEFFGGIALIFGLLTRVAALGLAPTMLVAMLLVPAPVIPSPSSLFVNDYEVKNDAGVALVVDQWGTLRRISNTL